MAKRLPALMRTRQNLSELIEVAARLFIDEALEKESREALGQDYYERGGDAERDYRDSVREGRLKTVEGVIPFSAPQIADGKEPFRSEIRQHLKDRTEALEDRPVERLARGLSTRNIEERRRLKIIPNVFSEKPALKLMFGAIIRAAERLASRQNHDLRAAAVAPCARTSTMITRPKTVFRETAQLQRLKFNFPPVFRLDLTLRL